MVSASWGISIRFYPPCRYYRENKAGGLLREVKMRQKIRVVGVVKNERGILVLKRRQTYNNEVLWELPTGKIGFGEQPEDAMERLFEDDLGVEIDSIKLKDAVTFLSRDDSKQYSNLCVVYDVKFGEGEKIRLGERYTAFKFLKDFSGVNLRDSTQAVIEIEHEKIFKNENLSFRETANSATVFIDGASRGNPGQAGIGYYIVDERGQVLKRGGEFIGFATSRMAEYYALRCGVRQAIELGVESARFVSDSLMVVNQMNGIFKLKNRDIMPVYEEIREMLKSFKAVAFAHVPRAQNSAADKEANLAIDRVMKKC